MYCTSLEFYIAFIIFQKGRQPKKLRVKYLKTPNSKSFQPDS